MVTAMAHIRKVMVRIPMAKIMVLKAMDKEDQIPTAKTMVLTAMEKEDIEDMAPIAMVQEQDMVQFQEDIQ